MKRDLVALTKETFDLVIVGGGISGAAIAREASLAQMKVALVEKNDFGGATSAATSKLIHGGLRYLKNLELRLVRESLRERAHLLRLAPHLVYPLTFLLPTYKHSSNGKMMIKMAMELYDLLSAGYRTFSDPSKNLAPHQMLSPLEVATLEPKVFLEDLTGGALYSDCLSLNPERLTLSFLLSACKHGAQLANYAPMENFLKEKDRVIGVQVRDSQSGEVLEIRGRYVINAGGPWSDLILAGTRTLKISRSQGIHFITRRINNDHAIALQTSSGRHYFIIPWRKLSLVGTTDKLYTGHPDEYHVEADHLQEFVGEVNRTYDAQITPEDIYYSYGGLRPLVDTQTDSYKASRRYEIEDHEKDGIPGLITVVGGKYTTSRQLAETVLSLIFRKEKRSYSSKNSLAEPLGGGAIPLMESFVSSCLQTYATEDPVVVEELCRNYGTDISKVMSLVPEAGSLLRAEVLYAIREEMALHLNDIVFRRIGRATTGQPKEIQEILDITAEELGWNPTQKQQELEIFRNKYQVYQPKL